MEFCSVSVHYACFGADGGALEGSLGRWSYEHVYDFEVGETGFVVPLNVSL